MGDSMKRRLSIWAAALVLSAAPAGLGTIAPTTAAASGCPSGFVSARIHHQHKCLRAGEYCKKAWNRAYHRYGYACYGNPPRLHST
jgi:hypothetical protein